MKWLYTCLLAGLVAVGIGTMGRLESVTAAQTVCLHGDDGSREQVTRRQSALGLTRDINTSQAMQFRKSKAYKPLTQLTLTRTVPEGFAVKLSTDGTSYHFSVVDQTDPCRFGYFSDDAGVIFRGEVIR